MNEDFKSVEILNKQLDLETENQKLGEDHCILNVILKYELERFIFEGNLYTVKYTENQIHILENDVLLIEYDKTDFSNSTFSEHSYKLMNLDYWLIGKVERINLI